MDFILNVMVAGAEKGRSGRSGSDLHLNIDEFCIKT